MTGTRADHDDVIEVGAVKFQGSRILGTYQTLVRPEKPLPYRTQVLTGIKPGDLDRAPRLVEVTGQITKFVGDAAIVGHSVPHDLEFLARAGLRFPRNPVWDTFDLASLLLPELAEYSLSNVAAALGVRLARVHRALDDAQVSRQVLQGLARRALDLDLGILSEINRILAPFDWPAKTFFQETERQKALGAFENSIGAQLRAKLAPEEMNLEFLSRGRTGRSAGLTPAETARPIDVDRLRDAFGESGPFARAFDGFERRDEQIHLATAIANALNDQAHLVAEAGTGTGKALDVDTPIPTPGGWKRLGDLRAGDRVFDENGHQCAITAAWPMMENRPCYEVVFSDGSVLVADHEHLWASFTRKDRKRDHNYNRNKALKRQTYGSLTSIENANAALMNTVDGSTMSVPVIVTLIGKEHGSLIRRSVGDLTIVGTVRYGARLYEARPLLTRVAERLGRIARDQRTTRSFPYTILTTEELRQTLNCASGAYNHAIPVAAPCNYPVADLSIDPYYLGVWLGDGSSRQSHITTADADIIRNLEALGFETRRLSHPCLYGVYDANGPGKHRWQDCLTKKLRQLGVLRNKHIPAQYLMASEAQRRALLAGLLDTDGTVSRTGTIQYTTTNPMLADGAHELACSLGYRATVTEGRAMLRGKDCGPKWTVAFTTVDRVFRLERKHQAQQARGCNFSAERNRYRYVVDVRPVQSRPVRCIAVDSPSRLYLAGKTFIPTHNSIGYLLPALEYAAANDRRVVVSTNTINLQEQLSRKDVPDLQRTLGQDPAFATAAGARVSVLKGRGNYLCLRRWTGLRGAEGLTLDEARVLVRILVWLPSTPSGDREELNLNPGEMAVWNRVSAQADNCLASDCSFLHKGTCFLARVRQQAEESHVVIVNHALLLTDIATENRLLPPFDHLIIDEAHHLEEEATHQLGFEIGAAHVSDQLDRLADAQRPIGLVREVSAAFQAKGVPGALRGRAAAWADDLQTNVGQARQRVLHFSLMLDRAIRAAREGKGNDLDQRVRLTDLVRRNQAWREVELAWENLRLGLESVQKLLDTAAQIVHDGAETVAEAPDLAQSVGSQQQLLAQLRDRLGQAIMNPDPGVVYWVAADNRSGSVLVAGAPLDVAEILDRDLFSQKASVVLTSATLATDAGFGFLRDRLGLHEAREVQVGSPFNYAESTLLYLPTDLPEPGKAGYQKAVEQAIAELCLATGGRALVLLTSHGALRQTHAGIARRLEQAGILTVGQAVDGSRRQVLAQFRNTERAVLLGTSSFWEGVDIPGEALSVLVIAKLPFAVPTDPVFAARSELYQNPFEEYALPQATLRFRQGFGRLIRTRTDRGVVAILDSRVTSRRYGSLLLSALPSCREVRGSVSGLPDAARGFLSRSAFR